MGLSPFRGFWDMQTQMNRMLSEMLGNLGQRPERQPEGADVSLHANVLTISGERKTDREQERGGYFIRERRYGSFSRSFTLPQGTDESQVHARFDQGLLEVTVEGAGAVE